MTAVSLGGRAYWPADTAEPVQDLATGDLLRAAAREAPDVVALQEVAPDGASRLTGADSSSRSWTYVQLLRDAEQCARWLLARFRPGERVVVWAPNVPEWVVLQYGAALSGLVLVTANPALRAEELRFVLEQSGAAGLFSVAAFRGSDMRSIAAEATAGLPDLREHHDLAEWPEVMSADLAADLPQVRSTDSAQIQYTSGTTGVPKGALLSHRGLVNNARYIGLRGGLGGGGRYVTAMPLFHTAGCGMSVLGAAHRRATLVLLQLFDPSLMLRAIAEHRADACLGVPTMLIALLDHPDFDPSEVGSVDLVLSGGAAVPPDLIRRVEAAFSCRLSTVYGQTELSPIVTQTSPDDADEDRLGTAGRPLWNVEVKIVHPVTGDVAAVGEQGEVCARGHQRMLGYFEEPELTAQTVDADEWLHTGDLGTLDDRGYLRITGRLKDMLIRGGENIFPAEIENLLVTHPDVADAVVIGVPDDVWGERVVAVVRLRRPDVPPSTEQLRDLCRDRLAPAKTPTDWFVAEQYPLTGSGKVQKFRVLEQVQLGAYPRLPADGGSVG